MQRRLVRNACLDHLGVLGVDSASVSSQASEYSSDEHGCTKDSAQQIIRTIRLRTRIFLLAMTSGFSIRTAADRGAVCSIIHAKSSNIVGRCGYPSATDIVDIRIPNRGSRHDASAVRAASISRSNIGGSGVESDSHCEILQYLCVAIN